MSRSHPLCSNKENKVDDGMEEDQEWKPPRFYACGRCDEDLYFENKFYWRMHTFKVHGRWEREENRDVLYDCRYCDKQFGLKRSRNAHHKTHKEHEATQQHGDVDGTPNKYRHLDQSSVAG